MGDALSGLLGFAFIVGLFVAYFAQRRAQERAKKAALNPPPPPPPPPADGGRSEPGTPADVGSREPGTLTDGTSREPGGASRGGSRSPNWGAPILYTLLLLGAATHRGEFWGYLWQLLYGLLVLLGAYSTFHPKEIAIERKRNPDLKLRDHYLVTGVPYVLVPIIGWAVTIPAGIFAGVFIPLLPWALLLVIAAVAIATGKVEKQS